MRNFFGTGADLDFFRYRRQQRVERKKDVLVVVDNQYFALFVYCLYFLAKIISICRIAKKY